MEGDAVYPGMPRMLYPGMPVPCNNYPVQMGHAQQFNQHFSGDYQSVSPFHLHPFPPFPYFFLPPPPVAAPSSSLTQALVDHYAPMAQMQLSYQSPDAAAERCWHQQQQHPSMLLPPAPPVVPATISQLPSPTLSPATLATLLRPGDGMSTNKLDELPSFFLGQVLDQDENHLPGAAAGATATPPSRLHHRGLSQAEQHHKDQGEDLNAKNTNKHRRNASCDTFYSEATPQIVARGRGVALAAQAGLPPAPLFESPFMPMAGKIIDLAEKDVATTHDAVSSGSEEENTEKMPCDPLEGVDLELLYQHFKEGDGEDDTSAAKGTGSSKDTTGTTVGEDDGDAGAVEEKKEAGNNNALQEDEIENGIDSAKDDAPNADLQSLFQKFVEDLDALPPLDLDAIGKAPPPPSPATGTGNTMAPRFLYPPFAQYQRAEGEFPMHGSPVEQSYGDFGKYYSERNSRKRGSSEALSFDPNTPEKRSFQGKSVGGLGLTSGRQQRSTNRRVVDKKSSTNSTTVLHHGSGSQLRGQPEALAAAPHHCTIMAMLPSLDRHQHCLSSKNEIEGEAASFRTGTETVARTFATTKMPTRCVYLFGKSITASDAGRLARIVLPRAAVEQFLPRCDHKNGIPLTLWDVHGNSFNVTLKFWMNGRPIAKRMWLLDHCQGLIEGLVLVPGTELEFFKADDGRLVVNSR